MLPKQRKKVTFPTSILKKSDSHNANNKDSKKRNSRKQIKPLRTPSKNNNKKQEEKSRTLK